MQLGPVQVNCKEKVWPGPQEISLAWAEVMVTIRDVSISKTFITLFLFLLVFSRFTLTKEGKKQVGHIEGEILLFILRSPTLILRAALQFWFKSGDSGSTCSLLHCPVFLSSCSTKNPALIRTKRANWTAPGRQFKRVVLSRQPQCGGFGADCRLRVKFPNKNSIMRILSAWPPWFKNFQFTLATPPTPKWHVCTTYFVYLDKLWARLSLE